MAMTPLNIFGHLEIGDALVLNGLVRTLAASGRPVNLFTGPRAFDMVCALYSDQPKIQPWWFTDYDEFKHPRWNAVSGECIRLGYFGHASRDEFNVSEWDREFYRQAKVPFDNKWTAFHVPETILRPPGEKRECVIYHEDPARGFKINTSRIPRRGSATPITHRSSFWDWLAEFQTAAEIHCIDSCFLNLADLLWGEGMLRADRLVYHKYARRNPPPVLRAPWEILT